MAVALIQKEKSSLRKCVFSGGDIFYTRSGYAKGVRDTIPASNAFGLPDKGLSTLQQLVRGVSAAAPVRAEQTSTGRLAPLIPLIEVGSVRCENKDVWRMSIMRKVRECICGSL